MKTRFDLSDIIILAGLALACVSLWQVSTWLTGAFVGALVAGVGLRVR